MEGRPWSARPCVCPASGTGHAGSLTLTCRNRRLGDGGGRDVMSALLGQLECLESQTIRLLHLVDDVTHDEAHDHDDY